MGKPPKTPNQSTHDLKFFAKYFCQVFSLEPIDFILLRYGYDVVNKLQSSQQRLIPKLCSRLGAMAVTLFSYTKVSRLMPSQYLNCLIALVTSCFLMPADCFVQGQDTIVTDGLNPSSKASINLEFVCPEGFVVEKVADDKLVHDAFCLTTDSRGNPVVSGPGYIRTLTGCDQTGRFTQAVDLKADIVQGAQGLWCEVGKYYFVADGGLWIVEDKNGDMVADLPRRKLFDLSTGGEHDAHAIRRGPDGWWYLIVGNLASNIAKLQNDVDAPVKQPRAGTLWRINSDFSKRGVWAHGLRNAYDFDFLADGSIVTYDSDEERELTLPWYRQTRVAILSAGSDAGWVDSAWSDLASRVTMPTVVSKLGRGSPTGVKVYDHNAFPQKYHNAIFVEDWTFGRLLAVYPQPKDSSDTNQLPDRFMAETFLQTKGTVGFAPTDITVAPDGSLLVCSGGRGTTGTLYRIRYAPASNPTQPPIPPLILHSVDATAVKAVAMVTSNIEASDKLTECLKSPSPLEAWSRAKWEPIWQKASQAERRLAISNPKAPRSATESLLQRRAIQFEVDLQNRGLLTPAQRVPLFEFQNLCISPAIANTTPVNGDIPLIPSATSRQTAWWAIGHLPLPRAQFSELIQQLDRTNSEQLQVLFNSNVLNDSSQGTNRDTSTDIEYLIGDSVVRSFYECVGLRRGPLPNVALWESHKAFTPKARENEKLTSGKLKGSLRSEDTQRSVRQIQLWAAYHSLSSTVNPTSTGKPISPTEPNWVFEVSAATRLYGPSLGTIDASLLDQLARKCAKNSIPNTVPEMLEAISLLQTSLGDYRYSVPPQQAPTTIEAIDGYRCLFGQKVPDPLREGWAKWCMIVSNPQLLASTGIDNLQVSETWKATVVLEAMRAIAMLAPKSPEAVKFCLQQITPSSHPTSDVHALITLACCSGARSREQTIATGDALAGVLAKVNSLSLNTESRWEGRLEEIWKRLVTKDSQLASAFVSRPGFAGIQDLFWLKLCPEQTRSIGRARFKDVLLRTPTKDWNAEVARFVWSDSKIADSKLYDYMRLPYTDPNQLRSTLELELLAINPIKDDYESFLSAVESQRREFLKLGWNGLSLLPSEEPRRELVALTSLWNRLKDSRTPEIAPKSVSSRIRTVAIKLGAQKTPLGETWNDWELFLKQSLGEQFPKPILSTDVSSTRWRDRVMESSKLAGDSDRGRFLYQELKCASCHGGGIGNPSNALGPSLTGVAKRFSREDLFQAIFEPSRDISDRYQATKVLTTDGSVLVGMKVYESIDGITLQLADGTVSRINQADIEEKVNADQSLMPAGLADSLTAKELADLYAYLSNL